MVEPRASSPTLTTGHETDSSEFDKYRDFPMEPREMYARIDRLKGLRRPGERREGRRRWGLGTRGEGEGREAGELMGGEMGRVGGAGLRKAFSSVINLLTNSEVPIIPDTDILIPNHQGASPAPSKIPVRRQASAGGVFMCGVRVLSQSVQCSAHFVLLGTNYTLKINWWPIDASHFDESYASPSHNGKISWFFTQRR